MTGTERTTSSPPACGRVFVVDDDPFIRQAMDRLFRSAGFLVATFGSSTSFLDAMIHDMPSCVVLDLMMPGLTGLDVQRRLIGMDEALPIVFISGQGDVPAVASAMRCGAVDFLVKPTGETELMEAVRRALDRDAEMRTRQRLEIGVRERVARLTPREMQVCRLVADGCLNKQIAAELGTAEKTIKQHRGRMMRKLEVQSVAALVRLLAYLPELGAGNVPERFATADHEL
jgi:FixJ family two-component response regulator